MVVLVLLLFAASASAQTTSGSISVTVVDTQDQVVPGADVTVTNQQTQEVRRAVTNAVGLFEFPALQAGPYTVRVELTGFRPIEIRDNMVLANSRLALQPMKLEVGTLAEAVTVSAVGEVVATTQTTHQARARHRPDRKPLDSRPRPDVAAEDSSGRAAARQRQRNGRRQVQLAGAATCRAAAARLFYVDGINGGDGGGGGAFSGTTVMDAIAEVNVQMSAYTAEYGLKGGSQINVITKHGGAEYHGTAYWYKRHEAWNSINYFNKINNRAEAGYRYSNLGGTIGGPIPRIKGINPDGNKLFFFYVDRRHAGAGRATCCGSTTCRPRWSASAISRSLSAERHADPDHRSGHGAAVPGQQHSGQPSRSARPGDAQPVPDAEQAIRAPARNFITQEPSIDWPRRQHMFRGDYRPTDRDSLSVKYQTFYTRSVGINVDGASARWGLVRQRYDFYVDIAKIDYTRILNTSTILEFSTGFFNSVENGPEEDDDGARGHSTFDLSANQSTRAARGAAQPAWFDSAGVVREHPDGGPKREQRFGRRWWPRSGAALRRPLADLRQ